jgi:hypothetical protein
VVVLVDKSAEDIDAFDPTNLGGAGRRPFAVGVGRSGL